MLLLKKSHFGFTKMKTQNERKWLPRGGLINDYRKEALKAMKRLLRGGLTNDYPKGLRNATKLLPR